MYFLFLISNHAPLLILTCFTQKVVTTATQRGDEDSVMTLAPPLYPIPALLSWQYTPSLVNAGWLGYAVLLLGTRLKWCNRSWFSANTGLCSRYLYLYLFPLSQPPWEYSQYWFNASRSCPSRAWHTIKSHSCSKMRFDIKIINQK